MITDYTVFMKNQIFAILITLFITHLTGQSNDRPVTITIPSGVKIELSGEVEMEFIDVEGERTEEIINGFKLIYSPTISYRFSLRFNDNGAYADKHYLLYKKNDLRFELGKNRPAVALKRETEGYPLIGTAYWKGRQYHIDIS